MQLVVPSAVSAAVAAAITILRRTSQILLFFFIVLCVFKVLINRVNCNLFYNCKVTKKIRDMQIKRVEN